MAKKKEAPVEVVALPKGYVPTLKKVYKEEIVPALVKQFSYTTVMQVPKLVKITINEGVGDATQDKKLVEEAAEELALIAGQKAVITSSKKDVSNFKLRKGMPIGTKVTLRNVKMYEFLEKLIRVSLPRIRDFNGIAEKLDGRGNYTLGLKEQIIFPEIDMDKNPKIHGMEITFVTTAKTDEEAYALLKAFGLPFKKHNN
ncbi:MAG: 50S ribosomal protein L5 [Bacteroidales bacterium]|nr:50S ribosomal protein L5 [Bacteroidales bacterium]MDT3361450.1 50S ribosomal protein L5 [Bacteroidota bacterium]MBQ2091450.1 50S ribosomal protein L5 [Bacteroidales bacterium]MBQ7467624.1 50S ribosomal protein L5 [Bacteroidales bacterium]MBQ8460879.1 50S ribosomal protein L5 [Bacteroidales bacterium]